MEEYPVIIGTLPLPNGTVAFQCWRKKNCFPLHLSTQLFFLSVKRWRPFIYLFWIECPALLAGMGYDQWLFTLCVTLPPLSPFEPGDCSLLADQGKVLLGGGGSNDKSLKIFHKGLGGDDLCRILKQRTCQWGKVQIRLI